MALKFYILLAFLFWNLVVFILYAMDKHRARHGRWRIPERTLLLCGLLGGGIGAMLGMILLRHKTRHLRFRILLPLEALLTTVFLVCLYWAEVFFLSR